MKKTEVAKNEVQKDTPKEPRKYMAPRVVTHSCEEIRNTSHTVNACNSYDPGADPIT